MEGCNVGLHRMYESLARTVHTGSGKTFLTTINCDHNHVNFDNYTESDDDENCDVIIMCNRCIQFRYFYLFSRESAIISGNHFQSHRNVLHMRGRTQ